MKCYGKQTTRYGRPICSCPDSPFMGAWSQYLNYTVRLSWTDTSLIREQVWSNLIKLFWINSCSLSLVVTLNILVPLQHRYSVWMFWSTSAKSTEYLPAISHTATKMWILGTLATMRLGHNIVRTLRGSWVGWIQLPVEDLPSWYLVSQV